MPPLRERREDIAELVRHFAARFAAEEGKAFIRGVSAEALDLLLRYDWPGNVRQLENAVVPRRGARRRRLAHAGRIPAGRAPHRGRGAPDRRVWRSPPFRCGAGRRRDASRRAAPDHGLAFDGAGDVRPLAEVEAEMIRLAIARYEGRMTLVARKLGIGRSTLYRKLRELGLDEGAASLV